MVGAMMSESISTIVKKATASQTRGLALVAMVLFTVIVTIHFSQDQVIIEDHEMRRIDVPNNGPCQGKEKLLDIVVRAMGDGSIVQNETAMNELCEGLPLWRDVVSLYGDKPVIVGLETCKRYRNMLAAYNKKHDNESKTYPMPRVAGLQNVGSTALATTFMNNFEANPTIRTAVNSRIYNVPWRKHMEVRFRDNITDPDWGWDGSFLREHVLPVVLVRDPYRWMDSMCKIPYEIVWEKDERHCPNLVFPLTSTWHDDLPSVYVRHWLPQQAQDALRPMKEIGYRSLAHLWSEWNREYVEASFPRLIIRFEDTIFHAEQVFQAVSDCVGLAQTPDHPFQRQVESAKDEKTQLSAGLLVALAKNGKARGRLSRMLVEDIEYAQKYLDADLMRLFGYKHPDGIPEDSYAAEYRRMERENATGSGPAKV